MSQSEPPRLAPYQYLVAKREVHVNGEPGLGELYEFPGGKVSRSDQHYFLLRSTIIMIILSTATALSFVVVTAIPFPTTLPLSLLAIK